MRWQDRTCQATAEQQERGVVEVGPHTLAEESWDCSVGGVPLLFSTPVPPFQRCKQSCSAYPRPLETGNTNLLGLGSFPAFLWQPGALPSSPGTPVNLSKMRKLLLTNLLSSRRCEVQPRLFRHLTRLQSTHYNLWADFRALTQFPFGNSSQWWMHNSETQLPPGCSPLWHNWKDYSSVLPAV